MVEQVGNEGDAEMLLETRASANGTATFSPEKPEPLYRYRLTRIWDPSKPLLCWVMLNPSTADHDTNDATIRKCISFARTWGYGGILVVNLFAYRSTDPDRLVKAKDPIGPFNETAVSTAVRSAGGVIVAWGALSPKLLAASAIMRLQVTGALVPLNCLGKTKDGHPRHPLYIAAKTPMTLWS